MKNAEVNILTNVRGFSLLSVHHVSVTYKYVDWNDSAAMLVAKRSEGVAPEVNLKIPFPADDIVKGFILALNPRADITRSPKQEYLLSQKKDQFPPKFRIKKTVFVTCSRPLPFILYWTFRLSFDLIFSLF